MRIDLAQLEFIDSRLREMVLEAEKHYGFEFTGTSLYRENDAGPHGTIPLRAVDIRCHDPSVGYLMAEWTNRRWSYDFKRQEMKCCVAHDAGQGFHLHYQVHPNTKRRQ